MTHQELANKLVSAKNEKDRATLLEKNPKQANVKLAWILKDICYESWTNEPITAQKTASALKTLATFNLNKEIKALSHWITGISELTKGNLEKTIENLERSAKTFKEIGKTHESAHTQVAKLIPLALLGKYVEAIKCGEDSLKIFEEFQDELSAGKIEKNLANIIVRQDGILKAEKYYNSAIRRFTKIKNVEELAMCKVNLANNYVLLHNFRQAEKYYAEALNSAKTANMDFIEAEIEGSLGNLAMLRGRYSEALRYLETARQKFEEQNIPHRSTTAELEIAEIYFELNLSNEAFEIYQKITKKLQQFKMQGEEAIARANLGKTAIRKREFIIAKKELKRSANLFVLEKNPSGAADVKLSEANLEFSLGNYKNALKIITEANKLLNESQNIRLKIQVKLLHGEILRKLKRYKKSFELIDKTFQESIKHAQLNLAQLCLNSLGKLALQKGDSNQAEIYFKKSIKMIEKLRLPLPAEEFQMAFLADKLAPFENLAKIYLSQKKIQKAFISIEKARSKTLAETLQNIGQIKEDQETQNSKLFNKLNDLREELNWFYSNLNRAEETDIENLQTTIKQHEKQIADVMRQIESTKPQAKDSKNIHSPDVEISIKNLQKQIGKQKALIDFVKIGDTFSVFVITDKKFVYLEDLVKEDEIISLMEGLHFQFGALRYGAKKLGKFIDELKKRTNFYLQKLYEKLLEPLQDIVENRNFVIIPVSSLHYVPFHALFDGEKYVIEKREVSLSPSAIVWQTLDNKPQKKLQNALLMGFADENIPLVQTEIKELEQIFHQTKSFVGKKATFSNYTKNASDFDVLHLACHGQFRPDNPLFSSLHLADGFVTVRDICSQRLNAELVTLSACETGLNKIFAGEEILGLARGFLTAGVSSLVSSLWTVNDEATIELMRNFYSELQRGKTVSASLRKAQIHFIEQGKHPYFWSPFVIIGR